jgi:hypothetical protein
VPVAAATIPVVARGCEAAATAAAERGSRARTHRCAGREIAAATADPRTAAESAAAHARASATAEMGTAAATEVGAAATAEMTAAAAAMATTALREARCRQRKNQRHGCRRT